MNNLLEPPAERDLPAHRSARMRAQLLGSLHDPARLRGSRRWLTMAVAGVVAVAGLTVSVLPGRDGPAVQAMAMSSAELSPHLRDVTRQCVEWNAQQAGGASGVPRVRATDLAMAASRDYRAVTMFLTPTGYFACDLRTAAGSQEGSGGAGGEHWPVPGWMPGPVERLSLSSSEIDSGEVIVAGRVSDRVRRLVLDHGNGHTTTARIERGVFGLISDSTVTKTAELVAYTEGGGEAGRRPLFPAPDDHRQCYADPSGTVVYGDPGPSCRPAEPWTR